MKLLSDQVDEREIQLVLRELEKTKDLAGDVVEFGCFVGTTSVFMAKQLEAWSGEKELWLYDSFEGLPEKSRQDENSLGVDFKKGELLATKKQLVVNLRKSGVKKLPKITKGWFSELKPEQVPAKISFAFLDGDYYRSILDPLELIWQKLESGAIVVADDYGNQALPGASQAVDEWCKKYNISKKVEANLAIFQKP